MSNLKAQRKISTHFQNVKVKFSESEYFKKYEICYFKTDDWTTRVQRGKNKDEAEMIPIAPIKENT